MGVWARVKQVFGGPLGGDSLSLTGTSTTLPQRTAQDFLQAYSKSPWLRAVESKIGDAVSSVRWRLYVVQRGGRRDQRTQRKITGRRVMRWAEMGRERGFVRDHILQESSYKWRKAHTTELIRAGELVEIEGHPMTNVLLDPNPVFVGRQIRKLLMVWFDILGEAYFMIERGAVTGTPERLWPMAPHWIQGLPDDNHPYFLLQLPGGTPEKIPVSEVLWFMDPDPASPYGRGSGFAKALSDELDVHEFISKYKRGFFYNQARPDFIGTIEGISPAEVKKFALHWNQEHGGFWRAFRAHFINRKMDIHEFTTNWPAPLTELSREERDTIIHVIGVPPEKLGINETSNRAVAETADLTFAQEVLIPRLELIREVLQQRFVPEFDERLVIDYDDPTPEDREFRLKAASTAPWSLRADEWRELSGFDPLPDDMGQVHMVPVGLAPVKDLREGADLPVDPSDEGPPDDDAPPDDDDDEDNDDEPPDDEGDDEE